MPNILIPLFFVNTFYAFYRLKTSAFSFCFLGLSIINYSFFKVSHEEGRICMAYVSSTVLTTTFYILAAIIFFSFLIYGAVSYFENETRAMRRALFISIAVAAAILTATLLPLTIQIPLRFGFLAILLFTFIILLLPLHARSGYSEPLPSGKIDERDIMFSRRLLQPGTEQYKSYYAQNPHYKKGDDAFRANPGLLGAGSTFYKQLSFAAATASFDTIGGLHHLVEKKPAQEPVPAYTAEEFTTFLKGWIKKLGAHSVGITELKPYHIYSHVGRGPDFGKKVNLTHRFAIALTVEMDKHSLDSAPYAPAVMESAQQYVNAGVIAIQTTEFIRNLGFETRAHIDGNYRVVCPLVARDAGLGTIGRMGLLMTPKLGPRVRIAVVTTNLPLIPDLPFKDSTVHEFCLRCKKCADVCPSRAISFEPPSDINGVTRWQINQEKCYTYWTVCGTDCGRCVSVCPYSHPDNLLHNLVRKGLRQSTPFQILALKMDDFFYGRKPAPLVPRNYLTL